MKTTMKYVLTVSAMLSVCNAVVAGTDKTLVSWVCLANTTQQGGSALTIQRGDQFDGIVFGEKQAGKWMAGSDTFKRTQGDQQSGSVEKAGDKTPIQMAIVYQGNQISIYRNGEPYASYAANNIDLLGAKGNLAVFGLRHVGTGTGNNLQGSIEDARIFDSALTADEIKKLQPNQPSEIKPYAWWTFEKGKETDLMGRFPINNLDGGAKIEGGRLMLETGTATLIAATKKIGGESDIENETLAMPANPPDDWLTYHLVHPGPGGAMPGDPNCAFYWKGRYHLHYIYNHNGVNFAHVSSDDLVHWQWQPTNLKPRFTGHGMFSGTGFFTKDGKPAIIYHGWGSGRNQIAIAQDDNLETWSKPYPLQPKVRPDQDGTKIANWDPDAWLDGDNYYALSGGNPGSGKPPTLFKSTDLKNWDYLGLFLTRDMPDVHKDEDISCPNFFKIGDKHMLLCISHNLGCRYYLGEWKDEKFMPDFHARMTWNGNEFFAPESVLTKDRRRVMWAWLLNLPIAPTGVQALPRELELPKDGVLRIRPLRELESLRYDRKKEDDITVASDAVHKLKELNGNALELEMVFKSPTAKEFGLDVLCDQNGKNGLRIAVVADSKTLRVGKVNAPFELRKGEDLILRVFIDKNLVEVFANDRQAAVAAEKYAPGKLGISLFSKGGDILVKQAQGWKMKSARCTQAASSEAKTLERISVRIDPKVLTPVRPTQATGRLVLTAFYADGSRRTLLPSEAVIQSRTKAASGNVNVVAIEGDKVVPKEGGLATIEAAVVTGGKTLTATTDVVVAPFYRDYHQTLVLKLFLGMEGEPVERLAREPLFQKPHDVLCTFEEALEVIRKADNLTRGIPKIVYLVGWQKGGHDHGYPSWSEVNPRMKRQQDATALDSLRWLKARMPC